jgi:hypothetical protein
MSSRGETMRIMCLVGFFLAVVGPSSASQYKVLGVGASTCGKWVKAGAGSDSDGLELATHRMVVFGYDKASP